MNAQWTMNPSSQRALACGKMSETTRLDAVVSAFDPISLSEMDGVALLDRTDTKFVLSTDQLLAALRGVRGAYRALTIQEQRAHHYRTLYFDTPGFTLYHNQVTGRAEVYKVREREYLDTRLAYLEVKHKNQKKRTEKSRMPVPCDGCLDAYFETLLDGALPVSSRELEPKLWNTFRRVTLVSKTDLERLTIDVDLRFFTGERVLDLDGIAVAEVKQDRYSGGSAFLAEMRRQGVRQTGFSKFCFGVAQLYPAVKGNTQKERALLVEKLQHGGRRHGFAA